jgi:hypothetical protein
MSSLLSCVWLDINALPLPRLPPLHACLPSELAPPPHLLRRRPPPPPRAPSITGNNIDNSSDTDSAGLSIARWRVSISRITSLALRAPKLSLEPSRYPCIASGVWTLYAAHYTLHIIRCTLNTSHGIYTIRYTMQDRRYARRCTLYTIRCTPYAIYTIRYTMQD